MMDGRSRNEEVSPRLLDLIRTDREWHMSRDKGRNHNSSEERKLELRLGPPGEDWFLNDNIKNVNRERDELLLSLGYFSTFPPASDNTNDGCQTQKTFDNPAGATLPYPWAYHQHNQNQAKVSSFLRFPSSPQSLPVMGKDTSQASCARVADLQNAEKKASSPSSSANTAVPNSPQKRTAPGPVVGWPPIRSFRKNIASGSSSKPSPESQHHQHVVPDEVASEKPVDNSGKSKSSFVKINMDGVPIGRKVDINAYDGYEKLSSAVDELFRGLLSAQRDSSAGGIHNHQEERAITGLLDGKGEYTLVYEDNEGDRMLAGDVPWHMFVSTVKRLRVLKSSELSAFTLGNKQDKIPLDSARK